MVVYDLFEGTIGPVEGVFGFVDPLLSFDVLSGFISCSNDVHDSSFMDLSIFEYLPISCASLYLHSIYPHHRYLIQMMRLHNMI